MSIPKQVLVIQDPGLGFVDDAELIPAYIGVSSGGATGTVYSFTDPQDVVDTLGEGPLVQAVAYGLKAGGKPIRAVKGSETTAATTSSITRVGATGPTMSVTGAAANTYAVTVVITQGGALGVGKFKYTLDGVNYSPELTLAASYEFPRTGITATFSAGTYVAGETYSFDTAAAQMNATNASDAMEVLKNSGKAFQFVVLPGEYASASAASLVGAGMALDLADMEDAFLHRRAMMDAGSTEDDPDDVIDDFAGSVSDKRVAAFYGYARVAAGASFQGYANPMQPAVVVAAARAASVVASTDLARFASGPLTGVTEITHDEFFEESGLDDAHISTLRSWPQVDGFYVTNCYLLSPPGSDFLYWQHGIVFDIACDTCYKAQLPYMNASVRVLTDGSGKINPVDAADIDRVVEAKLRQALTEPTNAEGTRGFVSGLSYKVDRDYDVLSNSKVRAKLRIVPLGYIKELETNVGFTAKLGA
jgi:hypothetical protein